MNGSDMRAKAAAMFGKSFMAETKPKPLAKNAAVASNKVSKARPIPAFKVGGPVKRMPFDVKPEDEGVTGSGNTPLGKTRKETVAKTATENAKNAGKPVKKAKGGTLSPFEKAFAAARKEGKKEFTFNGKPYTTQLKEEVKAKPAPSATPFTPAASKAASSSVGVMRPKTDTAPSAKPAPTKAAAPSGKPSVGLENARSKLSGFFGWQRGEEVARKEAVSREKAKPAADSKPAPSKAKKPFGMYKSDEESKSTGVLKKADGGRIGSRIMPINLRNPDAMGAGNGIGDMRASLGGVGGSMRPDYSGMQGRMMRDLDRESRMTGEAGTAKGVGLRVGARFKDGGKVQTSADTAKKLATEMGGMKCGGKAGKYAAGGAGKMRKGQCDTPTKLAKGGAGKVRKGMMTQKGEMLQAVKPGKGIGGK